VPAFTLDPQLAADTHPVADLGLCTVRLMCDAAYPWLVLVPMRVGLVEITDLDADARHVLMDEIAAAADALRAHAPCDKMNVGALGNMVAQLHVHVVARRRGDPAWPGPVWGAGPATPYPDGEAEALAARIAKTLEGADA
jgi:diadenosine tetraphosphate (Ap4A) HIT family hydrolase